MQSTLPVRKKCKRRQAHKSEGDGDMKILVVEDDLTLSAGICFEMDCNDYLTVAAYNCKRRTG